MIPSQILSRDTLLATWPKSLVVDRLNRDLEVAGSNPVTSTASQPLAWQGVCGWGVTGFEHFARIHRKREGAKQW